MATDILNRQVEFGGAFSADGVKLIFGSIAGAGFLVQQMGISYRVQTSRVHEIGSNRVYIVAGRTQGSASLSRLIGPKPFALEFYQKFSDICQLPNNNIGVLMGAESCGNGANTHLTLRHCFIEGLNLNVNAGDFLFNEQSTMSFISLESGAG